MSDMTVTNPLSGKQQNLFVAMADPVEEKLLHMVTADPARTPTFTPFAQGDYFLNASSTDADCADNDLSNCVFLPNAVTPPNQTFAWNHGGIQPEVRSTWVGWVGPGIEKKARDLDDGFFSDHTDIRPTMLALLGLKDSYVSDGRVVTEILKGDALPKGARRRRHGRGARRRPTSRSTRRSAQFSMDTLTRVDRRAREQHVRRHDLHATPRTRSQPLGAERDALAGQIRLALWNAEFNDQKIDEKQAKDWIEQANDLLDRAAALAAAFSSELATRRSSSKINHIVVIYEENHSFDNLYGGWEGVNGLANADARAHARRSTRRATRTPASSRTT